MNLDDRIATRLSKMEEAADITDVISAPVGG